MLKTTINQGEQAEAVVIKKYANRRLYNTETSTYVTLEDLAQMVRSDRDFVVRDAKSGDDLTHAVLTQIIVEQEGRADGPTLLPIPFLRQLIRYYDDSIAKMVPSYLQFSLAALTKEQDRFRTQFTNNPWGSGAFEAYQDQARRNLAIFEKAMTMWVPFNPVSNPLAGHAQGQAEAADNASPAAATPEQGSGSESVAAQEAKGRPDHGQKSSPPGGSDEASKPASSEIDKLKDELAAMQKRIENLSQSE